VPADRSLYFQLLDGHGREIRRMRSWVSLKPGEVRSCSGCHQQRMTTPLAQTAVSLAASQPAVAPTPRVSWGDKPVSFHRDIRPILDQNCAGCHTGLKPAGQIDVTDPRIAQRLQSMAAFSPAMDGAQVSGIRQFGSHRAPLFQILANETHAESLELSDQQWIDLRAWVDLNAPIHDRCRIVCPSVQAPYRYSPQGDIVMPPADARAVRVELDPQTFHPVFANRCAACHEQPETLFRPHWVDLTGPGGQPVPASPLSPIRRRQPTLRPSHLRRPARPRLSKPTRPPTHHRSQSLAPSRPGPNPPSRSQPHTALGTPTKSNQNAAVTAESGTGRPRDCMYRLLIFLGELPCACCRV
jgi:hypothetical protein